MILRQHTYRGSVLIVTVFTVAVLAVLVAGMLGIATEQVKLMENEISAAEAFEIADAGLNDAMSQIRSDYSWNAGYTEKLFSNGKYTVDVNNVNLPQICITATGVTGRGYTAKLIADATVKAASPAVIRIDCLKVNPHE